MDHLFVEFPEVRNYSRGIGDAWRHWKTKVGSCHNYQTSPEIGSLPMSIKPMKIKRSPFPTYSIKPCSASGWLRRQKSKIEDVIILALLDPIWLCVSLYPNSAACAQLITAAYISLVKTLPVSKIIPKSLPLSSWNDMFFWCQGMPECFNILKYELMGV